MSWVAVGVGVVSAGVSADSANKAAKGQNAANDKAIAETSRQAGQNRSDLAPYRDAGTAALTRLRKLIGLDDGQGPVEWQGSVFKNADELRSALKADYARQTGHQSFGANDDAIESIISQAKKLPQDQSQDPEYNSLMRSFTSADLAADPVYNSGLQFGLDEGTKAIERRAAAGGGYDSGATLKGLVRFGNDYGSTKAGESYGRFTGEQDRTFGKLSGLAGMGSGATNVGVNAGSGSSANLANLYTGGANAQGAATIAGGNALAGGLNNVGQYAMLKQLTGGGQRTVTPSVVGPAWGANE